MKIVRSRSEIKMLHHAIEVQHQGQTIRGFVRKPASGGRCATALLLHGFAGQRMENGFAFAQLSRALVEHGVATIAFDFRDCGESDGSFESMRVTRQLSDTLRMTEWACGQPFVDRTRLSVVGFSLGGLLAACAGARTSAYHKRVLLAPTTPQNLAGNICKRPGNDCSTTEPLTVGAYVMKPGFIEDMLSLDPIADVVKNPRPTLLVQGDKDTAVAPSVSQKFVDAMRAANQPVTHTMIPGADHGFSSPVTRQAMIDAVTAFLGEAAISRLRR
jgi:uncharacterized protein